MSHFTSKKFLPLFIVQFAGYYNDQLLRNALLVLVTFSNFSLFGLKHGQFANLIVACLIFPTIILSSAAGKLADSVNKVTILKVMKTSEVVVLVIAGIGFYFHDSAILILCLLAFGITAAFTIPIKYSILPQYLPQNEIIMASGYLEMGVFIAVLFGQASGSFLMASYDGTGVMIVLMVVAIVGLLACFVMPNAPATNDHVAFKRNFISENYKMYKMVTQNRLIWKNVHSIGWFLAVGVTIITQLSFLTLHYLGGDAHVLALCGALLTIGISLGSVSSAKLSNGVLVHKHVVIGALGVSLSVFMLLFINYKDIDSYLTLEQYIHTLNGVLSLVSVFFIGFSSGFFSLTCYSELPMIAPEDIRSQVTATSNLVASLYQIGALIVSSLLLKFGFTSWGIMFSIVILNILFAIWYAWQK